MLSADQTKLFVSLDGGRTWSGYKLPVSVFNVHYDILYHPSVASYILLVGRDRVVSCYVCGQVVQTVCFPVRTIIFLVNMGKYR